MKVTVLGMGYVGCVTAAVLAREGHAVVGVDSNAAKVEMLRAGTSPVLEPGLPELVRDCVQRGNLRCTVDIASALDDAEIVIICVGTPSSAGGGLDSGPLARVAEQIGDALRKTDRRPVVLLRSTALPDIVEGVLVSTLERRSGKSVGAGFGFVVNPEFLREGSSIRDFDDPEFTLLGTEEPASVELAKRLYGFLKAPVVVTTRRTAALVKYSSNAFHALKVAFANEIGALSSSAHVDPHEVMRIFALDHRLNLSGRYLKPGMPFGGSCLPKDIRAAAHYGRQHDLRLPLLNAVLESNRVHTEACVQRILAHGRVRVGVCGMAFKAGTDDLRESPIVEIVEMLIGKGIEVAIYDRRVSLSSLIGANREYVQAHLPHVASLLKPTLEEVIAFADVLVVSNSDEEFLRVPALMRPEQSLVDLVGTTRRAA